MINIPYFGLNNSWLHTPLFYIATYGTPEMIEILLRHGEKVNEPNIWGETALHAAVSSGSTTDQMAQKLHLLLQYHAAIHAQDHREETALHWTVLYGNDTWCDG